VVIDAGKFAAGQTSPSRHAQVTQVTHNTPYALGMKARIAAFRCAMYSGRRREARCAVSVWDVFQNWGKSSL
jgi:hypothetical protein